MAESVSGQALNCPSIAKPKDIGAGELPLVTIVTPTYNREKYLAATIESVLAQTYPSIEYIVVDDGSIDGTRDLCLRFDRVMYAYQSNSGQSAAINLGWSKAKGKYLMYLSSDDLLKPSAIEDLVNAAESRKGEVVIYPDYDIIDDSGAHIRDTVLGAFREKDFFMDLVCVLGPGVLFSKSLFDRHGGWNRRLRQVPDYEYWLRFSSDARIENLPKVLASSRVHSGALSYSKTSIRRSLEIVLVVKKHILPRKPELRREILARAYTISMRYQLRALQFGPAVLFIRKIWRVDARHLGRSYFLRGLIGESCRAVLRNAFK